MAPRGYRNRLAEQSRRVPNEDRDRAPATRPPQEPTDFDVLGEDELPDYPVTDNSYLVGISRSPQTEISIDFGDPHAHPRQIERPPGYWKLRNGQFVAIADMDDTHIQRALLGLERQRNARGRRVSVSLVYTELRQELQRRENRARMREEIIQSTPNARNLLNSLVQARSLPRIPQPSVQWAPVPLDNPEAVLTRQQVRPGLSPAIPRFTDGYYELRDEVITPPPQEPQEAPNALPEGQQTRRIKK